MKRFLDDNSQVWYDRNDDNLIIQGQNRRTIWELQKVEAAEEGHKLQLLSRVCCPGSSDSAAAAPCHHTRPSNDQISNLDRPSKKTKTSGLSPDIIANRLFDSVKSCLKNTETELQSCKAQDSSIQGLRKSLYRILSRHSQSQKKYRIWCYSFEHLCLCLDVCLQTTTDEESRSLEEARNLVLLRHRIVNAAVRDGLEEPYALALLPLLAGNKLTYLSRANKEDQGTAIDQFIKLIRPELKGSVWYLDPIAFVAWFYNLHSLHDIVATSDDNISLTLRIILGLNPFKRQGFDPSAKVFHYYGTPSADPGTPTSTDDPQAGDDRETVSPASSTTHIGVSANENGSGNDQLPSPISQPRARDPHTRARSNQDVESDERTPPPALPPNQPQRDAQESSPYPSRPLNEGLLSHLPPIFHESFDESHPERIGTLGQDLSDMISGWSDAEMDEWGDMLENENLF